MLRRLLLGMVALSVLLICYAVYVRAFSSIGRFAEIDPRHLTSNKAQFSGPDSDAPSHPDLAQSTAEMVFGPDSWQAKADIALYWLHSGVIIYVKDYDRTGPQSQSLVLKPFSLVYLEKYKTGRPDAQTITIQAEEAVLDFDRPIDIVQASGVKPIGGHISGSVQVHTDRGTPDPDDDAVGYFDDLEFKDSEQRIWTDGPVRIVIGTDWVITGTAGEARLKMNRAAHGKAEFDGIQQLAISQDVQINLVMADDGKLLPGPPKSAAEKPSAKPAKNTPVNISCQGALLYDLDTSTARFHRNVQMVRETGNQQADRLFCDVLRAVFEPHQPAEPSKQQKADGSPLGLREARATGPSVRVVSDSQGMEAIGNELQHDAASGLTILRGSPEVTATQRGSVIHAPELKFAAERDRAGTAEANGPGHMEVRDEATHQITLIARWGQWARVEPQGERQLLTLNDSVHVEQPDRGVLSADRVRVWLTRRSPQSSTPGATDSKSPIAGFDQSDMLPSRIEAIGRVVAETDQLDVRAAERLELTIKDEPRRSAPQPAKPTQTNDGPNGKRSPVRGTASAGTSAQSPAAGSNAARVSDNAAAPNRQRARLSAKTVQVTVLRNGATQEVSEVWTEGNVDLVNPPGEAGEQGALVRGQMLHMKRIEQANLLEVSGSPAHVELQEMTVEGPTVAVDQVGGVAWVQGKGMMRLPVQTDLDGHKLAQPGELIVLWGSDMFFDGKVAEFGGGVEVQHGADRLRCRRLEATLAEPINLAAPKDVAMVQKKPPSAAQIAKLFCTEAVQFDNTVVQDGRLEKYEHFEAQELTFTNSDSQMFARGPGLVRSYSRGQDAVMAPPAKPAAKEPVARDAAAKKPDQLYFTEVHFADQMKANRAQETAKFRGQIEAFHAPVADETQRVDPNKLPPGGMRLACQELEIGSKRAGDGKSYYEMVGTGNVDVEAQEFVGRSDRITYNQRDDRLIFQARPGNSARLFRQNRPGEKPDEWEGQKIWFLRRENTVRAEGARALDISEQPGDKKIMPNAGNRK